MAQLTTLNYLNVVAYIANAAVTYGVGTLGLFGAATNADLSEKYQTLVTPVGWAFAIWAIIFISQLIWTIVQLLTPFRAAPLVKDGVKWYYIGVCVAQIAWTVTFTLEIIWASLVAMLSILLFLFWIVTSQYKVDHTLSIRDFILLVFPFAIHCGWIIAASFVNTNVLLVDLALAANYQYYAAIASLAGVLLIAFLALFYPSRPQLVIPLVLAWASLGIYFELKAPKDLIVNTFTENQISYIQTGALIASIVVAAAVAFVGIKELLHRRASSSANREESSHLRENLTGNEPAAKKKSRWGRK